MSSVRVLVGTRKGLFVLTSDETRRDWKVDGPHLTGWEVFHAMRDPRDGVLHAATNNWVYGATAHRSSDQERPSSSEARARSGPATANASDNRVSSHERSVGKRG